MDRIADRIDPALSSVVVFMIAVATFTVLTVLLTFALMGESLETALDGWGGLFVSNNHKMVFLVTLGVVCAVTTVINFYCMSMEIAKAEAMPSKPPRIIAAPIEVAQINEEPKKVEVEKPIKPLPIGKLKAL